MVNIVGITYTVSQAVEIVYGGKDIVHNNVLGNENVYILPDGGLERLALVLLAELLHDDAADFLLYLQFGRVKVHIAPHIHHPVGEHAHIFAVGPEGHVDNAGVGDLARLFPGKDLTLFCQDLTGERVGHGGGQLKARYAGVKGELFVELVAAHVGDLIAAAVKEQPVQQRLGRLHCGGIARAQLAVYLNETLIPALGAVLVYGGNHALVLTKDLFQPLIGNSAHKGVIHAAEPGGGTVLVISAHGFKEPGNGQLAVFINADIKNIIGVGLVLQPGAVIGNDGGGINAHHGLVRGLIKIHAGGTDNLGNNHAFRSVDDEGPAGGHQGKISHEDFLLLDLLRLLVSQADTDLERGGVCGVPGLALFLGVLGFLVHGVVNEAQLKIPGIVAYGVHILENLPQAGFQKPLVGAFLDLQQVRHFHDLLGTGKALSQGLAVENIFWHCRTLLLIFANTRLSCYRIQLPC